MQDKNNNMIHGAFLAGLIIKGLNATAEILGGLVLFLLNNDLLLRLATALTHNELSEDPSDQLSQFLIQTVTHLSVGSRIYGAIYLLSHGLIKIGLVWALLKKKLFAYPLAISILSIFIIYQLYRFSYSHSPWMIVLTILDIIVIILTWLEYKRIKSLPPLSLPSSEKP
jgi:uncharacterized membrane protein